MTVLRRAAAAAAVVLVALLLPVLGAPSPAHACSCAVVPLGQQARDADATFVGVVREVELDSDRQSVAYTIDVERSWSADLGTPVVVTSGAQSSACGISDLEIGNRWLMLADDDDGELSIGLCDGSSRAGPQAVRTVAAALGPGTTDVPGPDGMTYGGLGPADEGVVARSVGWACAGGALVAVAAVVALVVRRGRRGG